MKLYNLQRNKAEFDPQTLRNEILEILDGPGCSYGYRNVWHALQLKGIRVPRAVVEELVRQLDPEGVEARNAHKLRRRMYICPGPNMELGMQTVMTNLSRLAFRSMVV